MRRFSIVRSIFYLDILVLLCIFARMSRS